MFIGTRHLKAIEALATDQVRVFQDACDLGLAATDTVRAKLVTALRGLNKDYVGKASRWECGSGWEVFIPFEHDPAAGWNAFRGVHVQVTENLIGRHSLAATHPAIGDAESYYSVEFTTCDWSWARKRMGVSDDSPFRPQPPAS